ncbi:DUF421 domain-containing protein [Bacillaceae bacterium S4-13-58]
MWEEAFALVWRTGFTYIVILIIFRVMGKREIGELSILDLVVFLMLAEMAVFTIEDPKENVFLMIIPMVVLLLIQLFNSKISLHSHKIRRILDGSPSIIINRGKIDEYEMKKQKYNFDDLLIQLREEGITQMEEVDFAILEPSGKLSILKNSRGGGASSSGMVYPLITDGKIHHESLKQIGKTQEWLLSSLKQQGYTDAKEIAFCSINDIGKWTVDIKNEKR